MVKKVFTQKQTDLKLAINNFRNLIIENEKYIITQSGGRKTIKSLIGDITQDRINRLRHSNSTTEKFFNFSQKKKTNKNWAKDRSGFYDPQIIKVLTRTPNSRSTITEICEHMKERLSNLSLGDINLTYLKHETKIDIKGYSTTNINHHFHSLSHQIVNFTSAFDLENNEVENVIKTILCFIDYILWFLATWKTIYYFCGRWKTATIRKKDTILGNYVHPKPTIVSSAFTETDIIFRNNYGIISEFETGKESIVLNKKICKQLELQDPNFYFGKPIEVERYNSNKRVSLTYTMLPLRNRHLKKHRSYKLFQKEFYENDLATSLEITKFRYKIAYQIFSSRKEANIESAVTFLQNERKFLFYKQRPSVTRATLNSIVNRALKRIQKVKENPFWKIILAKDNFLRVYYLPRYISLKENRLHIHLMQR